MANVAGDRHMVHFPQALRSHHAVVSTGPTGPLTEDVHIIVGSYETGQTDLGLLLLGVSEPRWRVSSLYSLVIS